MARFSRPQTGNDARKVAKTDLDHQWPASWGQCCDACAISRNANQRPQRNLTSDSRLCALQPSALSIAPMIDLRQVVVPTRTRFIDEAACSYVFIRGLAVLHVRPCLLRSSRGCFEDSTSGQKDV